MKKLYLEFPETPGVYLMKDKKGEILYIGKAGNLKRRVSSYFTRPHDYRIDRLVSEIKSIDIKKTDTAIEALILEAELIKKHQPLFNVREKDDTSFLYVEITPSTGKRGNFPQVILVRGRSKSLGTRYGPFTSAGSLRLALRIIRKIFPYSVHPENKKFTRPCFDYQIGLCPGTCIRAISQIEYQKTIRHLKLFFIGKKKQVIKHLTRDMKMASKELDFETAEKIKRQIFALTHIQDVAFIGENVVRDITRKKGFRIEGYDISNISGTSAVGSMVVFLDDRPVKSEYRKFRIRTIQKANDVGMLKEMIIRRFGRPYKKGDWPLPDVILIDGGKGQRNVAKKVLSERGLRIPIVAIAKGARRKKNEFIGGIPAQIHPQTLIRARDEAHRFAITYHRQIRNRKTFF